jgi:FkbM family methyltransferase
VFERLTRLLRPAPKLRLAVVTPVGPGHAGLYAQCRTSVEVAWRCSQGPFATLELIAVDDGRGELGRSRARNLGIERAAAAGADWIFFLDADDLMVEGAFAAVATYVADYDAVWGMILGLSPTAIRPHLRIPQIVSMTTIEALLLFDPFLTLQMGHFVRTAAAQALRFDEALDAGEDFDYYLRLWSNHRAIKVAREFFINRHARHSTGPRAASAMDWGHAVRGRQLVERERRGFDADAPATRVLRNAHAVELQAFCRQQGLVRADDCAALSAQMPYHGEIEVNEYEGGVLRLHTENDDAICAQLAWTGEYQPFAAALWQVMAAGPGAVVDAGAGTGFYALLAARVAPQSKIFCLEPLSENLARARVNVAANAAANIEFIEAVAADFAGDAQIRVPSDGGMLPHYGELTKEPARPVRCLRIDDALRAAAVDAVTAVHIGRGNNASAALRGMAQILMAQQPDLLIDVADAAAAKRMGEMLRPLGYHCHAIDNVRRELASPMPQDPCAGGEDLQLFASRRSTVEVSRIASAAMGRLRDD